MNLKFHMQHDQTAGLQTFKSQRGRDSKMAADTKKPKPLKSTLTPQWLCIFGWNFVCINGGTLVLSDIKMKKNL